VVALPQLAYADIGGCELAHPERYLVDQVEAWVQEMTRRGVLLPGGGELFSARDATTIRIREGEVLVADGPFAETKEQIAGFDILQCADLDEAMEVAVEHPAGRLGTLELRPFLEG
jgi:hypothetical protein